MGCCSSHETLFRRRRRHTRVATRSLRRCPFGRRVVGPAPPAVTAHQPVGSYPLAFRRFAQYAFIRFDMALLFAALIACRFRFRLGVGFVLVLG